MEQADAGSAVTSTSKHHARHQPLDVSTQSAAGPQPSPSTASHRDRSVSMNMHAPPSKKHRASDDENEQASPSQRRKDATTALDDASDADVQRPGRSAAARGGIAVDDEDESSDSSLDGGAASSKGRAFSLDGGSSGITEESFMSWLVDQVRLSVSLSLLRRQLSRVLLTSLLLCASVVDRRTRASAQVRCSMRSVSASPMAWQSTTTSSGKRCSPWAFASSSPRSQYVTMRCSSLHQRLRD